MGFDYWALGHIHKRQVHSEAPWVIMPGIPQGRDIGEAGPKSASLLTIENGLIDVTEVPTSIVDFIQTTLDVSEAENDDALRAMLRKHLAEQRNEIRAPTRVLRLTLSGRPARYWQILRDRDVWLEQVNDVARVIGDIWIDKLLFDLSAPEAAEDTVSATNELWSTMEAISSEPGFAAIAQEEVETILQDLPATLRERLMPDETARDALVEQLAKAGANRVLARMKGAES
jgi:DNA repair exonuclease SbcCD nuclease subunit